MTAQQKEFLVKLLSQISVNATNPDSLATIQMVQSILEELKK